MSCEYSKAGVGINAFTIFKLKWKTTKVEDDHYGRRPKWKTTEMEDDLIDVGDCGWRVNQPGNSAIPRFWDFFSVSHSLLIERVSLSKIKQSG